MVCVVFFCTVPRTAAKDMTPDFLNKHGVILEDIGDNRMICIVNTGEEKGAHWFLLDGGYYNNRLLGTGLSAFHLTSEVMASPDKKYLAVLSVGEGHPGIEVIDLPELLEKKKYKILHEIDPYPGVVSLLEWKGQSLIVTSDVPLTMRNKNGRVDSRLLLPEAEKFSLDTATGKITSITFSKKKLILHHILKLSAKSKWKRMEAAEVLKVLEAKEALTALEKALKKEKDKSVIKSLKETIKFLKSK